MRLKLPNEYMRTLPGYEETPKAVYAALAYSLAMRLTDEDRTKALALLADEWQALNDCQIVPQPVSRKLRRKAQP